MTLRIRANDAALRISKKFLKMNNPAQMKNFDIYDEESNIHVKFPSSFENIETDVQNGIIYIPKMSICYANTLDITAEIVRILKFRETGERNDNISFESISTYYNNPLNIYLAAIKFVQILCSLSVIFHLGYHKLNEINDLLDNKEDLLNALDKYHGPNEHIIVELKRNIYYLNNPENYKKFVDHVRAELILTKIEGLDLRYK